MNFDALKKAIFLMLLLTGIPIAIVYLSMKSTLFNYLFIGLGIILCIFSFYRIFNRK